MIPIQLFWNVLSITNRIKSKENKINRKAVKQHHAKNGTNKSIPFLLKEDEAHVVHRRSRGFSGLMRERTLILGCSSLICTYTTFSPYGKVLLYSFFSAPCFFLLLLSPKSHFEKKSWLLGQCHSWPWFPSQEEIDNWSNQTTNFGMGGGPFWHDPVIILHTGELQRDWKA